MSVITRLLQQLFGRSEHRIIILGFDSPGRTTALYKLKLGDVGTTIPTIGFNVETLSIGSSDITMWDVGGRSKMRALWRHYYDNTQAVIFMVRSDKTSFYQGLEEYKEELSKILGEEVLRDAVLMVWANFRDRPDALPLEEITEKLELEKLRHRTWKIFGTVATSGEGLQESMEWLTAALNSKGKDKPLNEKLASSASAIAAAPASIVKRSIGLVASAIEAATTESPSVREPPPRTAEEIEAAKASKAANMEASMLQWLEENYDEAAVLKQFEDGGMKQVSHKERLLLSWVLLRKFGRREAISKLVEGTKRIMGDKFHETTLYFWLHMAHYALESTANPLGDFRGFLLLNPQLANPDLLLDFYSQDTIWKDEKAKTEVVLPDIKPLPSLITPVEDGVKAEAAEGGVRPPVTLATMSDEAFVEHFTAGTLPSWGHETKLRAIYLLLGQEGRRQSGTNRIFDALKKVERGMHNVTESYFWIQMLTYSKAKIGIDAADNSRSYADFIATSEGKALLDPDLLYQHYSDGVLADGVAEFRLPDKKPMPSIAR
mmetsp:Transcript_15271/g.32979  ORF Transcript_15271/g.32979 Transcript_15271/m.32979 type:complete len:547 (-) Transcript_15271:480-2120(-)